MQVLDVAEALPRMQGLASRLWSPDARQHPGQLAWSAGYALPEDLEHGPVAIASTGTLDTAWAWQEAPGWMEFCVDPADASAAHTVLGWATEVGGELATTVLETETSLLRLLAAAGFVVDDEAPWFTHHLLDLAGLDAPSDPDGYHLRAVGPDEAEQRAACHRAAWSTTSKVSGAAYARLMGTPPYRHDLDWVAVDGDGRMVASALVWLDPGTGVALVEPVGCLPEHRGRGLAGTVSLAALHDARRQGARVGLVCPRGDAGYPVPQRVYRGLGFTPHARTLLLRRPDPASRG
ncbi:MAG: GNAT family N-acetyltransferase [Nocardioides sp.]